MPCDPLNLFSLNVVPPLCPLGVRPSVLLPQLYSRSLRVSPRLPHWCSGLQLRTSQTATFHLFLPFSRIPVAPHACFSFEFLGCVFFYGVVLWLCVFFVAPGRGGEHHEGEDAQERREVVVLLARQKQQHQIGDSSPLITFLFTVRCTRWPKANERCFCPGRTRSVSAAPAVMPSRTGTWRAGEEPSRTLAGDGTL